jgi:hypothetical protein
LEDRPRIFATFVSMTKVGTRSFPIVSQVVADHPGTIDKSDCWYAEEDLR